MMKKLLLLLFGLVVLASGCSNKVEKDIFAFQDTKIGDNNAVVALINRLKGAEAFEGVELATTEKPYGMRLSYHLLESQADTNELMIYNATFLFSLIDNAEWLTFNIGGQEQRMTREKLQAVYPEKLANLDNELATETMIAELLAKKEASASVFE